MLPKMSTSGPPRRLKPCAALGVGVGVLTRTVGVAVAKDVGVPVTVGEAETRVVDVIGVGAEKKELRSGIGQPVAAPEETRRAVTDGRGTPPWSSAPVSGRYSR